MHWLAGRVAVVTGASRGIGAATAAGIAAAGAHVVLAARDREALDRVASRIRHAGSEATPVPTDVSNDADVERLKQDVNSLTTLRNWLAVCTALATIFGLAAGTLVYRFYQIWPLIFDNSMEVTIEPKSFQGHVVVPNDVHILVHRPEMPSDPTARWILHRKSDTK